MPTARRGCVWSIDVADRRRHRGGGAHDLTVLGVGEDGARAERLRDALERLAAGVRRRCSSCVDARVGGRTALKPRTAGGFRRHSSPW
jgi:uncharacterized small protein (DUF1192 family)